MMMEINAGGEEDSKLMQEQLLLMMMEINAGAEMQGWLILMMVEIDAGREQAEAGTTITHDDRNQCRSMSYWW